MIMFIFPLKWNYCLSVNELLLFTQHREFRIRKGRRVEFLQKQNNTAFAETGIICCFDLSCKVELCYVFSNDRQPLYNKVEAGGFAAPGSV